MMLNRPTIYSIILIIFLGLLVYANSLPNPFIWDDQGLIVGNYLIKDARYLPKIFTTDFYFASAKPSNFYRPVHSLFLMLDYYLFGLRPWGYHLTNILVHIANAIMIYFILINLKALCRLALMVSLLFVVHPIHTEAVAYISGLADPLVTLFILGAFYLFIKYKQDSRKKHILYCGSIFLFALGLLSKELAVVFPFVILFYGYCFAERINKRKSFFESLPFFAFTSVYIISRLFFLSPIKETFASSQYAFPTRLIIFITNLVVYLRLLILPAGLHMSYSVNLFTIKELFKPEVFFSILFFIFILLSIILSYKKRSYFIAFWQCWFFIFLLPQSGLFPINAFFAEHFIYLSSIGFFTILVYPLIKLPHRIWISIFLVLILFYGYSTIRRNLEWRDPVKFYESLTKKSAYSFAGYNNLGLIYEEEDLYDEAEDAFKRSIRIKPDFLEGRLNLARIWYKKGKVGEAINQCRQTIKENPSNFFSHAVLASIYADEKMYFQAIAEFNMALKLSPEVPGIYNSLGLVYRQMKDYDLAIGEFKKAIALDRKNENFYNNLGVVYKDKAQYQLAIDNYFKALKINKNLAQTHSNLGVVYGLLQRFNDAESEFREAISLNPDYVEAYFNLGSLYWQAGRPEEAKISWQEVLRLEPENKLASEWLHKLEK